ncbi:hypothetical protein COOONC_00242 [Cooperia oncophora]
MHCVRAINSSTKQVFRLKGETQFADKWVLLMAQPKRIEQSKFPSSLIDPTSLIECVYQKKCEFHEPITLPNNVAPRVSFRKPKKIRRRVDDIIFVNLLQQVRFIAEHFQHNERESEISDDWTFVAMVLDRLFLLIFSVLNVGTMFIILEAPSLYDYSDAMNITVPNKPLGQANLFGSHSLRL